MMVRSRGVGFDNTEIGRLTQAQCQVGPFWYTRPYLVREGGAVIEQSRPVPVGEITRARAAK